MSGKAFIDHFSALEDPRQAWKVVYPLPEILLLVLCATLGGAEDFVEIARWGQRKLEFLRRLLPFARGIASHDTLNDVMNALPAGLFAECFTAWVEALRERAPDIVAIDGKTSRRSKAKGSDPLHLVSAWASRQRLVLGQEAVAEKSNEINAIPLLLARLELEGALVTIDAMGSQTDIAKAIRGKGADYLLALKDNWPALAEEVRRYFDTAPAETLATHETTDGDHGRIEVRRAFVSHDVAWLASDRRFPGEWRFEDLAMIGMVEAEVERDGKTSIARRYYLSSAPLSARAFAAAVRAHWGIENRLHWVLDIAFREDESRVRQGHADQNLAVLRRLALNLLHQDPTAKMGTKAKRLKAGWDHAYLLKLLAG
jgi:predicted transposase YbfD/YdcC